MKQGDLVKFVGDPYNVTGIVLPPDPRGDRFLTHVFWSDGWKSYCETDDLEVIDEAG